MINESIAQLQAQMAEVDDQYLAEQAQNPSGMTGLMAAIEMTKRSKMRSRAAAVSDSYAHKDGTVVQDTLSQFQAAQAQVEQPQGYADGGRVKEYGASHWSDQFGGEAPWLDKYRDYTPAAPERQMDYGPYEGLGSVGRGDLARLNYDRRRNPQSPSPDYDMPAGPPLPPDVAPGGNLYSPYDIYSSLPIVRGKDGSDLVGSAVDEAAKIAGSIPQSGGSTRSAVSNGNAASAPGTPNFESEYEKLLAGIKGETPKELAPPKQLEPIDAKRVERLNRAMALGAMAKQFATQNSFVGGFGSGAADASAIMAAGRHQYQGEVQDQQKVQSQYDIANSEMMARERLADKSATNNINLSRVNTLSDMQMNETKMAHDEKMTRMQVDASANLASINSKADYQLRELDWGLRAKADEAARLGDLGLFKEKAKVEKAIEADRLKASQIDADRTYALREVTAANDMVSELYKGILAGGQVVDPEEAFGIAQDLTRSRFRPAASGTRASDIGVGRVKP